MIRSPENKLPAPEGADDQESQDGSDVYMRFNRLDMLVVIEQKSLSELADALENGNLELAESLIMKEVGHTIEQMKPKDKFGKLEDITTNDKWKEKVEKVGTYRQAAVDSYRALREKNQNDMVITQEDLEVFSNAAQVLYRHLEHMLPADVRRAHIDEGLEKSRQFLVDNPGSSKIGDVENGIGLLEEAQKRVDEEYPV